MANSPGKIAFLFFILQLFFLIAFSGCVSGGKNIRLSEEDINRIKRLAIVIPPEPEFQIIIDQATLKGTAPFPLIPMAFIWAYKEDQDEKRVRVISPKLADFSCRSIFLQTLHNALANTNRFSEIRIFDHEYENKNDYKSDAALLFKIKKWGLQAIVDPVSMPAVPMENFVTPFIEYEIRLINLHRNSVLWEDQEVAVGPGRYSFQTYSKDTDHLKRELKKTVEELALRIADTLIYQ